MAHAEVAEGIENAFVRHDAIGFGEGAAQIGKCIGHGVSLKIVSGVGWPQAAANPNDPRTSRRAVLEHDPEKHVLDSIGDGQPVSDQIMVHP